MTPRWDVLGVGECSLDELARVDALPPPGGKARVLDHQRLAGGQIATALLGCARLGHVAAFVGSVGDDAAAHVVLAPLLAAGIDLARVRRVIGAATRSAWIWVDSASGERTVLWQRDERLALGADAVARDDIAAARVVLVDATDLALSLRTAALARELEVPCIVDADTAAPGIEALLEAASHPVISSSLARAIYGGAENAVLELARAGAALPIVTLGREGAIAWLGGAAVATPAFAIDAADTTGAGDAFHAGIAHGLLAGITGRELLRVAHAVAACACLAVGAQTGLPSRAQLAAFLANAPPPAPMRGREALRARSEPATPPRAR